MKTSPDVPSNHPGRTLTAICLIVLAVVANAQVAVGSQTSKVHCLSQTKYFEDGSTFFFDTSSQENLDMSFDDKPPSVSLKSSAPVIVYGSALVKASVDSWIDLRGFIHNTNILERQVRFNSWLQKSAAGTPGAPAGVLVTGILDRPTLWASYNQMQFQLDYAQSRLQKLCAAASGGRNSCADPPWPDGETQLIGDAIGPARQALADYKTELETVILTTPAPYEGLCDDTNELNLEYEVPLWRGDFWAQQIRQHGTSAGFHKGNAPEMSVSESVNLTILDSSKLARLASLEKDAQRRMQYLADLSGAPN